MSIFATEVPVRADLTIAEFAAQAIAWIRGIKRSTVLDECGEKELYRDSAEIRSASGEVLSFKSYHNVTEHAYGVRSELPDDNGRIWRIECVYLHRRNKAFLRVRGQCVALTASTTLLQPKKPHFLTQVLEEGWGIADGVLSVQGAPHFLQAGDEELAGAVLKGEATEFLPCVYVAHGVSEIDLEHLARRLAGICHVVVEPDRRFSEELSHRGQVKAPSSRAIGLFDATGKQRLGLVPRIGNRSSRAILDEICSAANSVMSGLAPKCGWEWQQLQEAEARSLREQALSDNSRALDEYIDAFDRELKAKDERIHDLERSLWQAQTEQGQAHIESEALIVDGVKLACGAELYDGEFDDRLRYLLNTMLPQVEKTLDPRTAAFARNLIDRTEFSGRAAGLAARIKNAGKDGNQMPAQLGGILQELGYKKSQDGKHLKFTPGEQLFGLPPETLPSTPSDSQRGGKNRAAEVIRSLALNDLK